VEKPASSKTRDGFDHGLSARSGAAIADRLTGIQDLFCGDLGGFNPQKKYEDADWAVRSDEMK